MKLYKTIAYYLLCIGLFFTFVFLFWQGEKNQIFRSLLIYFLGIHVVWGYIRKETLNFGWTTIDYNGNTVERVIYLAAGIFCIAFSIYTVIH